MKYKFSVKIPLKFTVQVYVVQYIACFSEINKDVLLCSLIKIIKQLQHL
jgi:hypothetical protein